MSSLQDSKFDEESQRIREILRRSRMGLFEDIDDLRDELAVQLEDFESRLRRTALHLPRWLALPDDALRPSFELPGPEHLAGTLIGPRAIAMVASEVEQFLLHWFGSPEDESEIPVWEKFDDHQALDELRIDLHRLEDSVAQSLQFTIQLADEGPLQLERVLESVVFELEERRELDVEALESLIHDGDVEVGNSAQTEIAELWEEQRRRVGQLQRVWDDILTLHHEGITRTTSGLEELEELIARARQGLEGATLLAGAEPEVPVESSLASLDKPEKAETPEKSQESEKPAETIESSAPIDDGPGAPDLQPTLIDAPGPTAPMLTAITELARHDLAMMAAQDELLEPPIDSDLPTADESPTIPELIASQEAENEEVEDSGEQGEELHEETQEAWEQWQTEPEWAPDPEWEEAPEPEVEQEEEVLRLRTFRIREGWQEVTTGDMAATLGPPGLFLAVFFLWTLVSLLGLAENPMLRFPWALPATFAAMALCVLLPLLLRWRPMWSGTKFAVIRRGEVEDEVDLRLTNQRLYFDRISWPLTEIQGFDFQRWEDRDQSLCGWLLTIEPPYHKPLELSTLETDRRLWQESQVEWATSPYQAWQLPPEELDQIHGAIAKVLDRS